MTEVVDDKAIVLCAVPSCSNIDISPSVSGFGDALMKLEPTRENHIGSAESLQYIAVYIPRFNTKTNLL